jgi:hypothetical protein
MFLAEEPYGNGKTANEELVEEQFPP